jgi:hypothetical protein
MKNMQRRYPLSTYEKGKTNFIIFHGILRIGFIFTTILALLDYSWNYGFTLSSLKDYLSSAWFWIIFRCIFFGYFMGLFMWRRIEGLSVKQE